MRKVEKVLLYLFCVVVLYILYLFALNGRYQKINEVTLFDKWSGTVNTWPSKELPYEYNNKKITE